MTSNRLLQECLEDFTDILRLPMALYDQNRNCVAGEEPEPPDAQTFENFSDSAADMQALGNRCLFRVGDEQGYILSVSGNAKDSYSMGQLACRQLERLLEIGYKREDRSRFAHDLLLDNLLPMDIAGYAKQMHVDTGCRWTVFLVEGRGCEAADIQMILKNILANRTMDFVAPMEEHTVAVLRSMKEGESREEMEELAHVFVDTVSAETLARIRTSCGTPAKTLREASRSYKEAKMALEVAEIFDSSRTVITYEQLGIGRLIYQLPVPLCEMFLREVFGACDPEEMDEELLSTIYRFMDNNLNLSETSRQLYVHRNTLVYRLEKLQRTLGLDIRKFEDAMTFKIAMMGRDYMKYLDKRED